MIFIYFTFQQFPSSQKQIGNNKLRKYKISIPHSKLLYPSAKTQKRKEFKVSIPKSKIHFPFADAPNNSTTLLKRTESIESEATSASFDNYSQQSSPQTNTLLSTSTLSSAKSDSLSRNADSSSINEKEQRVGEFADFALKSALLSIS